jgi:hypothetical protein
MKFPKAECWKCHQIVQTYEECYGIVGCELLYCEHVDEEGTPCTESDKFIAYKLVVNEKENV